MIKFFDNKVPFFIRERINHASFSCPYTLGWKDLPSEEPNLHSNWSHENLAQFHILPYIQKCISKQFPDKTFHIFHYYHAFIGKDGWMKFNNCESITTFVRNGEAFEIPVEDLMGFYKVNVN